MQGTNKKLENFADSMGCLFLVLFIIVAFTLMTAGRLHSALNFEWKKATTCKKCDVCYFYEYKKDFCEKCGNSGDWDKEILVKSEISFENVLKLDLNKAKIEKKEINEDSSSKETH